MQLGEGPSLLTSLMATVKGLLVYFGGGRCVAGPCLPPLLPTADLIIRPLPQPQPPPPVCPAGTTLICCPPDQLCNGACCAPDSVCVNGGCCPPEQLCNGACCAPDSTCVNGVCCPPDFRECNGVCCPFTRVCCNIVSGQSAICCPPLTICNTCISDGIAVPCCVPEL